MVGINSKQAFLAGFVFSPNPSRRPAETTIMMNMAKEIPGDFSQNRASKHHATRRAVISIRFGCFVTAASE
jgi:hypothetical protein